MSYQSPAADCYQMFAFIDIFQRYCGTLQRCVLNTEIFEIFRDIVAHYKGKVYSWDVINEPFDDSGNFRRSIWYNNFGESYIAEAFKLAHAADPSAKLYINDYNIESISAKSTAMYNLVKKLKNEGVPIHGVGIQGHLIVGNVPSAAQIQANIERYVY